MTLLLRLDTTNAWRAAHGPRPLAALGPTLDKLRDQICIIDEKVLSGSIPPAPSRQPLGTGFVRMPERLLSEYEATRSTSELGRMLAATKQLMAEVDRVVVWGDAAHLAGPRALLQACCQPYFNELSRGDRGSRPRMLFLGPSLDNDEVQGVFHLLGTHRGRAAASLEERWGLVIIGHCQPNNAANALLQPLLAAHRLNNGGDLRASRARTLLVTSPSDPLFDLARQLAATQCFYFPPAVGARFSVLSISGLLTAALVGINVMKLLEGARFLSRHFQTQRAADNLVLQFAAVQHLMDRAAAGGVRHWCAWSQALSATGRWYQQLLGGSLGRQMLVEDPLELGRRCPQCDPDVRSLLTQVMVDGFRFDPLPLATGMSDAVIGTGQQQPHPDGPVQASVRSLVDSLQRIQDRTQQALQSAQWPTLRLQMPQIDELGLGQLLQMLMLATLVEARLMGCNPFPDRSQQVF